MHGYRLALRTLTLRMAVIPNTLRRSMLDAWSKVPTNKNPGMTSVGNEQFAAGSETGVRGTEVTCPHSRHLSPFKYCIMRFVNAFKRTHT